MQINNDTLKKIAGMSENEFKKFISDAASESGVSIPAISSADVERIRSILRGVENGDPTITKAVDGLSKNLKKGKGNR